jgi:hypothetical protein
MYIQGVSGGIVNILGGGSMDYSEFILTCVQFSMGVEIQLFEWYGVEIQLFECYGVEIQLFECYGVDIQLFECYGVEIQLFECYT